MSSRNVKVCVKPEVLIQIRKNSGYSVEDVARKLRVDVAKVLDVESGKDTFTLRQLIRLSEIYLVPLAAFFSDDVPDVLESVHIYRGDEVEL